MKKYLVTGGAGFLGSHLCKRLLETSNRVLCIDDLSTGSLSNIDNIIDNDHFEFIKKNITHDLGWVREIDGIFNLGAQWKTPPNNINGNCEIANFKLYNRVLSAAEVLQNFNALRGRFGL